VLGFLRIVAGLLAIGCALLWVQPQAAGAAILQPEDVSAQGDADIEGPLGPLPLPGEDADEPAAVWTRRVVAAGVAVGLLAMACYLYVRRRRRPVTDAVASPSQEPSLAEQVEGLDDGEFYARLLSEARGALAAGAGRRFTSLTPRELAVLELPPGLAVGAGAGPVQERWRQVCLRAEAAEYSHARVESATRKDDLRFVLDLIASGGGGARRQEAAREP